MKSNKLDLAMNVLKFGLVAIGVVLCLLIINGPNANALITEQEEFREGIKLGATISYSGILLFACTSLVVLFFVVQLITNTKRTIFSIIGIIVAFIIYFILSLIGTGDTSASLALKDEVSKSTISSTSAGLYTVIIGLVIAILVIVLGPFMGRMRK